MTGIFWWLIQEFNVIIIMETFLEFYLILCWSARGQSFKTFYTSGRCKIKCLNCRSNEKENCNPINMLGRSVLTLYDEQKFVAWHCLHALGCVCKFILRWKKFYRIGPWSRNGANWPKTLC